MTNTRTFVVIVLSVVLAETLAYGQTEDPADPKQVVVSVKVVEFQASKGIETGLSSYFARRNEPRLYGRVSSGKGAITSADITFPAPTAAGITVFLDRLRINAGDIEMVLQALVDENRASIVSRPKAMVLVGSDTETRIRTAQDIPYEDTKVVGATAVQVTSFEATGVTLGIKAPEMIDDDGNWNTTDDTYIRLAINADVKEEGQRIVVALDDQLGGPGGFTQARNAISVPEFISRSINTEVWVRHGQVLMLGGLYRNTESRTLSTLPWLTQAEDIAGGLVEPLLPAGKSFSPLSSVFGNRAVNEGRRELVFFIKAESWRPAYTVREGHTPLSSPISAVSTEGGQD